MKPHSCTESAAVPKKVYQLVMPVQQDSSNACWIAVYTMLQRWKKNDNSLSIRDVLSDMKPIYAVYYETNSGLSKAAKPDFIHDNHITAVAPQNFTVAGWADMIESFGPLSVAMQTDDPVWLHVLVLVGVDTSTEQFTWIDPADGKEHTGAFSEFLVHYEIPANRLKDYIQVYHL
jgi:hypothetical protein